MGSYISAFIIPQDAKKVLTDMGWLFESKSRLSEALTNFVKTTLHLKFEECYSNIERYSSDRCQLSAVMDDVGLVEHVHIKIYGDIADLQRSELMSFCQHNQAELFIPSDYK